MGDSSRRFAMKTLASVPILGALAGAASIKVSAHGEPVYVTDELEALTAARMVNTLQLRHFQTYARYAALVPLSKSDAVVAWLGSKYATKNKMGWEQFRRLDFGGSELSPGWSSSFIISADGQRYTLLLKARKSTLRDFATDENGKIYEGRIAEATTGTEWLPASAHITGGIIGSRPKPRTTTPSSMSGVSAALASLAALLVVPLSASHCPEGGCCCFGNCCHGTHCACLGSCQDSRPPGSTSCTNCGCDCCEWCCSS